MTGKHTWCEPAQSKSTWTFHKSQFVWKFTGKLPDAPETTSIKHRAFTATVRTPEVWPHCLGNNHSSQNNHNNHINHSNHNNDNNHSNHNNNNNSHNSQKKHNSNNSNKNNNKQ